MKCNSNHSLFLYTLLLLLTNQEKSSQLYNFFEVNEVNLNQSPHYHSKSQPF